MASKLDLLLINVGGTKRAVYQDLSRDFSAVDPPLWAALTAGFVRQNGYSVEILDAGVRNLDFNETVEEIVKAGAALNIIVVYSQQANVCTPIMTSVGELCRAIKARDANIRLMLTGWHPSALPQRTLQEEACDFVAKGEGFVTILGLMKGQPYAQIPGLWWKENGRISSNPPPPNIEDLTGVLGDVAWDLLPLASGGYRAFNWMCLRNLSNRSHVASLLTSLGCPYKCTFCGIHATFGERRIRYWSPDWVLKQFDVLYNTYGVRNINLNDELFVFNPRHYIPIAEGLAARHYDLNLCAFARVDRVDKMADAELCLLKKAGFNWFKLGIESISDVVLSRAKKGHYNKDVIRRVVNRVHAAGIDLCANFIFGLPGDTLESMQANLDFAVELNCAFPSFFCAMAVPGSDLYDEALRAGIPLPDKWVGYASQGYDFLPLPTESLSASDVLRFRDNAFHSYFTNPVYLNMLETKFGKEARNHIEAMTKVRLKRKLLGD